MSRIVRYMPELTYGRPGVGIVLLRHGGLLKQELLSNGLVRFEASCNETQWQTALWCCGIDPAVVTCHEPHMGEPVAAARTAPHRPYIYMTWKDQAGQLGKIVRCADGAVMWSGYLFRGGPTNGPCLYDWDHQPGACTIHPDWAALSSALREAIMASLVFLELPPPARPLASDREDLVELGRRLSAKL